MVVMLKSVRQRRWYRLIRWLMVKSLIGTILKWLPTPMKAVNHVSMLPSFIMVVNGKEKHFTHTKVVWMAMV